MNATRTITASLSAVLSAAALAAPAAAVPADAHNQPNGWHGGNSAIPGSNHSAAAKADTKANVYVPPADLGLGDATTPDATPPTRPANQQPIGRPTPTADAPSSGFDWGSGGIGVAAGIGAFAIALAGTAGMRRRRITRHP
jgi:hypothetical protein